MNNEKNIFKDQVIKFPPVEYTMVVIITIIISRCPFICLIALQMLTKEQTYLRFRRK